MRGFWSWVASSPGRVPRSSPARLAAVAWEPSQLDELEAAARAANSASGSSRPSRNRHRHEPPGRSLGRACAILPRFRPHSPLRIEAVMTHLYASDESNGLATASQLDRLEQAVALPPRDFRNRRAPEWLSVGASAALLGNEADIPSPPWRARRTQADVAPRPGAIRIGAALRAANSIRHQEPVQPDRRLANACSLS